MTVTAAEARVEYLCNGSSVVFAYPYQFFQNDDLEVWLYDTAAQTGEQMVMGVDYTVTGALNPTGGSVTMTVAPSSGKQLIILNNPDIVQINHYINADDFPAASHENALDRLTKICQRLSDRVDRAVRAPDWAPDDAVPDAGTLINLVEEAQAASNDAIAASNTAHAYADQSQASSVASGSSANNSGIQAGHSSDSAAAAAASATLAQSYANAADVQKIIWQGAWNSTFTYSKSDAASYQGSSWVSKTTNTNKPPATNPSDWDLMALKGTDGTGGGGITDAPSDGKMYGRQSGAWAQVISQVVIQDTPPTGKPPGTLWWESDSGVFYVFYDDGNTQQWVQAAAAPIDSTLFIAKSGDTMAGPLLLAGDPTAALQAATKQYVDARVVMNYLSGLTLSTPGTSTNFTVQPGQAADSSNSEMMRLLASMTKTMAAWVAGTGNGALDTGTIANATWYHVFLIKNPLGGALDILISTSPTAPVMPSGFTLKRRIGGMFVDGTTKWLGFKQLGDEFLFTLPITCVSAIATTAAGTINNVITAVPPGVQCVARLQVDLVWNTAACQMVVSAGDNGQIVSAIPAYYDAIIQTSGAQYSFCKDVRTNTAGQVCWAASGVGGNVYINSYGYFDRRGRDG